MSHSGLPPLPEDQHSYNQLVPSGMLLPSGEANFFDFRQDTSSEWDSTTPTGSKIYYSPSGDWSTRNPNYVLENSVPRSKKYAKRVVASGINFPFPHPYNESYPANVTDEIFSLDWWKASGIYQTHGEAFELIIDKDVQSGIFHFNKGKHNLDNVITNSHSLKSWSAYVSGNLPSGTPFNDYIYHLPEYPFHDHQKTPVNNLTIPNYEPFKKNPGGDAFLQLMTLRGQQERKYVPYMNLYSIKHRNKVSLGGKYSFDKEKPSRSSGTFKTPEIIGICTIGEVELKGLTADACLPLPGAAWKPWNGACVDSGRNCTNEVNQTLCLLTKGNSWYDMTCEDLEREELL